MLATIIILQICRILNIVTFPHFSRDVFRKVYTSFDLMTNLLTGIFAQIFPLPLLFVGNLVCGLGSTKRLSLPMFTVLRRFTILFTMIAEYYILKWVIMIFVMGIVTYICFFSFYYSVMQSFTIKSTVVMMVGGALIASRWANILTYISIKSECSCFLNWTIICIH